MKSLCYLGLAVSVSGAASALAATGALPTFRAVQIDGSVQIGYGVAVADVNGDRRPDILLADKDQVAWFENPSWRKSVIAEKLTVRDNVGLAAADIDGDGLAEVVVGANWNPADTVGSGALFYLVAPADRTQRWTPVPLPHEPTAHRMRWVRTVGGTFALVAVPLHGRGNNPATGEGVGGRTLAYSPPKDPHSPWPIALLDDALHKTHNFDPVQWDQDDAQELLIAAREGVFLIDPSPSAVGSAATTSVEKRTRLTGDDCLGAGEVRAGKLPGGRRFFATVEPMHGHTLAVYVEPPAAERPGPWQRHVLDDARVDGHALVCGDFMAVGHDQIVVGWRAMNRPGARVGIRLFAPTAGDGSTWENTQVDDNTMACEDLQAADLDGDGRLDLVASGRATRNLKIYFNEGLPR